jgi:hypothetical protein
MADDTNDGTIYMPPDTITPTDQVDPATGATVSPDGGSVVFPGDTVYPSDSARQKELDEMVKPYIPSTEPAPSVDPATGATVSPDGGSVVFPGDTVYPSDSARQKELDDTVNPYIEPLTGDDPSSTPDGF